MEIDKLEVKDEYTKEEVRKMIDEVLFQVSQDIDENYYDIKDKISEETNSLLEAGLQKRKNQALNDRRIVDDYVVFTQSWVVSECCDAEIVVNSPLGDPECVECGEVLPETNQKDADLKRLISFVNEKIDSENQ